jgi:hypothetical protein
MEPALPIHTELHRPQPFQSVLPHGEPYARDARRVRSHAIRVDFSSYFPPVPLSSQRGPITPPRNHAANRLSLPRTQLLDHTVQETDAGHMAAMRLTALHIPPAYASWTGQAPPPPMQPSPISPPDARPTSEVIEHKLTLFRPSSPLSRPSSSRRPASR